MERFIVLLVEDDDARGRRILELLGHPRVHITWARTAVMAISFVRLTTPDLILLDYDLDEATGVRDLHAPNGGRVANVIAALPAIRRPDFAVIHSMNPGGRVEMRQILDAAGVPATIRTMDTWDEAYAGELLRELGI